MAKEKNYKQNKMIRLKEKIWQGLRSRIIRKLKEISRKIDQNVK